MAELKQAVNRDMLMLDCNYIYSSAALILWRFLSCAATYFSTTPLHFRSNSFLFHLTAIVSSYSAEVVKNSRSFFPHQRVFPGVGEYCQPDTAESCSFFP